MLALRGRRRSERGSARFCRLRRGRRSVRASSVVGCPSHRLLRPIAQGDVVEGRDEPGVVVEHHFVRRSGACSAGA